MMSHLESPNNVQNSRLKDGLGRQHGFPLWGHNRSACFSWLCVCVASPCWINCLYHVCLRWNTARAKLTYVAGLWKAQPGISLMHKHNISMQTSSFEGSFGWIVLMPHKEYNVVLEVFLVILTVKRMQFQSGLLQSKKAIYLQSCCGTSPTLICT